MAKIYLASSWRNAEQPAVVEALRAAGHEVYDFRNPKPDSDGFRWSEIDGGWQSWGPDRFREALKHPVAEEGFGLDFDAMRWADTCVLLLPCGRSAHLELGWAIGAGKRTAIVLAEGHEPELMYKLAKAICLDVPELLSVLARWSVRTGDAVFHRPSGENWLVAFADADRDEIAWCGWPPGFAKLSDCDVVQKASDADSLKLLREIAGMGGNDRDHRRSWARSTLAEMGLSAEEPAS